MAGRRRKEGKDEGRNEGEMVVCVRVYRVLSAFPDVQK